MDELISRKSAVSRISDLLIIELKGQRIPTWNEVYNAIGDIPSVPAVPLDKLCEWLNQYDMPCEMCEDYLGCSEEHCDRWDGACWKMVLTKWMKEEGLWTE